MIIQPGLLDNILQQIQSHHFEEGIYLVKRQAITSKMGEHYGVAIVGKYVKMLDSSFGESKIIHKTDLGVHCDSFDRYEWTRVEKVPEHDIYQAIERMKISLYDPFSLPSDNCEHFARFITTGKKESSQVKFWVGLSAVVVVGCLLLRSDN